MSRFVLLLHECPPGFKPSHWDLMLERNGALMTWSLATLPRAWATALAVTGESASAVDAQRLADHRVAYLAYEGPVSGDRGDVRRCDGGECRWVVDEGHVLRIDLHGAVLHCSVILRQLAGERWRLDLGAKDLPTGPSA